jgi:hypothetical protein
MFDPSLPSTSFVPPPRRRARRRRSALLFLEQAGGRAVVKSYVEDGDPPGTGERRTAREMASIEAFKRLGQPVLEAWLGPAERLDLVVDGRPVAVHHAIVFPFLPIPVLYDVIAETADPSAILREAGERIRTRHRAATRYEEIHDDGSAHNVFSDWRSFDFWDVEEWDGLDHAKAREVHRFLTSVVEVSPMGTARGRVAAFCGGYGDRDLLRVVLHRASGDSRFRRARTFLRVAARPDRLLRLRLGETQLHRRLRTWRALDSYLGR